MLNKFDHVSFEHVCSGIGIPYIYRHLRDVERIPEEPDVAAPIASAVDPTAVIVDHGLCSTSPSTLCAETIDMFVSILASEASNLVQSFNRKGRFAELMARIPIHVVVSQAGLAGAAACGLEFP
jgi:glucokinase